MNQRFQGPFGPLVLTLFAPHQILRAIGLRAHLILTPGDWLETMLHQLLSQSTSLLD